MVETRRQGPLISRGLDEVKSHLQQMEICNWRNIAKKQDKWRRIVLETKKATMAVALRSCSIFKQIKITNIYLLQTV